MSVKSADSAMEKVQIWDAPTRVFHWLLVLSFVVSYITAEGERWRLVHVTFGYTFGALLVFRLIWGVVGTRYARFSNFVRGPVAVLRYVESLKSGRPQHHLGHNPAGAVAIVLMIALGLVQLVTGWAAYNDVGGEWRSQLHELAANAMVLVIVVHLAGVLSASVMHHENLVRAMLTGKKTGWPSDAIAATGRPVAVMLVLAAVGFWLYQWQSV
jgi:cytochrome b